MNYSELLQFHGHTCPGLAIGYRLTQAAMTALGVSRAGDEELVAIVENDACGVDALQVMSGCTFGKGNLLFLDYGKQAYTLYSRTRNRGVRVVFHGRGVPKALEHDRMARIDFILAAPEDELLTRMAPSTDMPPKATVRDSAWCDCCGERVMVSRLRESNGRRLCIPCLHSAD